MYYTFIFIIWCYFFLIIIFIIYTFLYINRGSVIRELLYYLSQGIPNNVFSILCNISVYYNFIFIIWCYFFLIIILIIYTFLQLSWGCVIWSFFYQLIRGIPINLFFIFSNDSVYYTFVFFSDIFLISSSSWPSGNYSITIIMASRLVSISCSEISLYVSSRFLLTQSSITTVDKTSGYSSLTSHISTITEDVILESVAFLFLY